MRNKKAKLLRKSIYKTKDRDEDYRERRYFRVNASGTLEADILRKSYQIIKKESKITVPKKKKEAKSVEV